MSGIPKYAKPVRNGNQGGGGEYTQVYSTVVICQSFQTLH